MYVIVVPLWVLLENHAKTTGTEAQKLSLSVLYFLLSSVISVLSRKRKELAQFSKHGPNVLDLTHFF